MLERTKQQQQQQQHVYFITGANSGIGLEATRQLAERLLKINSNTNGKNKNTATTIWNTIYLLCRSEEKANAAIHDVCGSIGWKNRPRTNENEQQQEKEKEEGTEPRRHRQPGGLSFEYIKFDAYDDKQTIEKNVRRAVLSSSSSPGSASSSSFSLDEIFIGGILLNAGGFGDAKNNTTNNKDTRKACDVAQLNIIGHVHLVNYLIATYKTTTTTTTTRHHPQITRIVAVGSEASFAAPAMTLPYSTANFVEHLSGMVPAQERSFGINYGWIKGILALYWAAFARRYSSQNVEGPENAKTKKTLYVVTVSPGKWYRR